MSPKHRQRAALTKLIDSPSRFSNDSWPVYNNLGGGVTHQKLRRYGACR